MIKKIKAKVLFREVTVIPDHEHQALLQLVKIKKLSKSRLMRLGLIELFNKNSIDYKDKR